MTRWSDLADVAIETIAAAGMRGLTHRAVDRSAGLPEGSTSTVRCARPGQPLHSGSAARRAR
jgi:hypothetical protein